MVAAVESDPVEVALGHVAEDRVVHLVVVMHRARGWLDARGRVVAVERHEDKVALVLIEGRLQVGDPGGDGRDPARAGEAAVVASEAAGSKLSQTGADGGGTVVKSAPADGGVWAGYLLLVYDNIYR